MRLPPLIEGRLIRRYKRFLADVELQDGSLITAHTPNTGRMRGLTTPGNRVWLRDSANPGRRYRYSWVLVETELGVRVGIDTGLANALVREAIEEGTVSSLRGYRRIRQEVRYGEERSRIDLLLQDGPAPDCFVEVKNVTLMEDGIARFPDAVTERGRKHLRELERRVAAGQRGAVFFCIQRADAEAFRPADHIDPDYAEALTRARDRGVEALAWRCSVSPRAIRIDRELPIEA